MSDSFTVASVSPGTYVVQVQGSTGDSASATFTVKGPTITLSPTSGPAGINVAITGSGFNPADVWVFVRSRLLVWPSDLAQLLLLVLWLGRVLWFKTLLQVLTRLLFKVVLAISRQPTSRSQSLPPQSHSVPIQELPA